MPNPDTQLSGTFISESLADEIIESNLLSAINVKKAVIDSREIMPGDLFVAMRGTKHNGHAFVEEAIERGAAAILIDEESSKPQQHSFILVRDSLMALQRLGSEWREQIATKVLAITGSVGKTTTKNIAGEIFSNYENTSWNRKNYNNEISVPLCLLETPASSNLAIIEMGMYEIGEIDFLCKVAKPDIGIVLNVGPTHLSRAGSLENIQLAKSELPKSLPENGHSILNFDDPLVWQMRQVAKSNILGFSAAGNTKADVTATNIEVASDGRIVFDIGYKSESTRFSIELSGTHLVENVIAVISSGIAMGYTTEQISQTMENMIFSDRIERTDIPGGITILNDTYNSQPKSLEAALRVLDSSAGSRIALLGDMLELGSVSRAEHIAAGIHAASTVDHLVTIGYESRVLAQAAKEYGLTSVEMVNSNQEAIEALLEIIDFGDTLLIKGSHSLRLDEVASALISELKSRSHEKDKTL